MSQQERFLPPAHRGEQARYPGSERSFMQREMSGRGRSQALQQVRQHVPQQHVLQENRPPSAFQHVQAAAKAHHGIMQQPLTAELQQRTRASQRGNLAQRTLVRPSEQTRAVTLDSMDSVENSGIMNTAEVTGKLTAEYARMNGKIDNLQLCLTRSEETCREADAMKERLQDEILQLQKSNEQLTQQLQSEVGLRDNTASKVDNVQSVCLMVAEHCERVRSSASGIGMLEATLRKHQADLQAQIDKLETEYNTLASECDKEKAYLQGLVDKEHEMRLQEITSANERIMKSELELNNLSGRLRTEQEARAKNLQLLQERETKIHDLEQWNANQAKKYESQICNSGSALAAANSEIASLRQALMNLQLAEKDYLCKIVVLKKDNSVNQDTIQTTEMKVQKMENAIDILVKEKNELFQQLKSTESELVSYQNEKATLSEKLEDAHHSIQMLTNDKEIVSERLLAAQKSNADLEQVKSEIVLKLLAANAALDGFTTEKLKMMNDLQQANSSIKLLTEEKDRVTRDLRDVKETLEREKEQALYELQEAKSSIEFLENKRSETNAKLGSAQQLIETLEADKSEILAKLQGMGDSAKNVELEKDEVYQKLLSAETAINALMLEKVQVLDQLERAKSTITCMEVEKDEVISKLEEAEAMIDSVNTHKDQLSLKVDDAKTSIRILEEQVGEAFLKVASAEERYNTLMMEKQQVVNNLCKANNSIEELVIEKSSLNEQITSASAKINALELEKEDILQQLTSAESKIQTLELEIMEDRTQMQNIEDQVRVLEGEKVSVMKELESAQSTIQVLETEKEEYSNKLQEAETTNVSTGKKDTKKIKGLETKIHALEKEKSKLSTGLESSKTELNALKKQMMADQAETLEKMKAKEATAKSEKTKVLEELQSVRSALEALESYKMKAEELKEALSRQVDDLQKQMEDSLTAVKMLQNEKNEEILKAKDIQKGVESYKLAFVQQKKDIESEKLKYMKEMASLQMEITAVHQNELTLAAEKKEMEIKFITDQKTWKAERIRLAKAAIHYKQEVKRLKNEIAKIGEISAASSTSGSINLLKDEMSALATVKTKSCLRSPKEVPRPFVEDIPQAHAPKKRVMFQRMDTESDSDTDHSIVTRRQSRQAMSSSKKICYDKDERARAAVPATNPDSVMGTPKRTLIDEPYKSVDFNALFED